MKRYLAPFAFGIILFLAAMSIVPSSAFANVLSNAGFEEEIGTNWDSTNGAIRINRAAAIALGFSPPPQGNFAIRLQTAAQFTFQTYGRAINSGDLAVFSAQAESAVLAPSGGELRIEFRRNQPDGSTALISATNSARINATTAPALAGFVRFNVNAFVPTGTDVISFVLRGQAGDGDILFDDVSAELNPEKLSITASKNRVKVGDVVTIYVQFNNTAGVPITNAQLVASIPRGLEVLSQSVRVNGRAASSAESENETMVISVGAVNGNEDMSASFQVLITSGVALGKQYEIGIIIRTVTGIRLSERGSTLLAVKGDPVFDEGAVIGKVFDDQNQNGIQDKGEKGVPGVRLATEEGIVIITDEHGKYHIPGLAPGRHVIKIDGHSLPQGSKFISEESYLIKITSGIMNKANFAVLLPPNAIPEQFREELKVVITQGVDSSRPVLHVRMQPDILKAGLGKLEKEPSFHFKINYPDFVKNWKVEIRDEMGREVWTGFGVGAPPAEVVWGGQTNQGLMIEPGLYSYQFKVEDPHGRQDWTPLQFSRVLSKADSRNHENTQIEIPPVGDFNIFKDGKQSIPLVAKPTIRIQGKTKKGYKVIINSRPIPVNPETGAFETEFYTSPGPKDLVISAVSGQGESTSYRETLKIRDSTFFMVGLGEQQLGNNFVNGHLDSAADDRTLKEGFSQDGRLSYYLRGKIKGKFLIQSHYDTSDKRSALFTHLDPDDYYPVYGDASRRDYESRDTLQRFYFLVEMDRSYVKWGSFESKFTDTELATYDRTLSGFKANLETTASTPYGDPKRGLKVFLAPSQHRGAHDEFAATGGSLYYLRNRRVVQGSEKIRVEVRDKIQNMALSSQDMKTGADYDIDYDEGRIILSHPLSSAAASDTLVSPDILEGNPVYLIVDYEVEGNPDFFENKNGGLRGYTHVGDHLRIGGTAIQERRQNAQYDMRGIDGELKVGRNTRIFAEIAQGINKQVDQSISQNGGLSFRDLNSLPNRRIRDTAFVVRGETKPAKNLESGVYIQRVDPGFSNSHSRSQEGFYKYGLAAKYKFTDYFNLRYRFDNAGIAPQLRPLADRGVDASFEKFNSHIAQAAYDDSQWLAQAEYQHRMQALPSGGQLVDSLYSIVPYEHALAGKLGYRLNDRLLPYVKVQTFINAKAIHQFGGGVRYEIVKGLYAYMEEMVGRFGDSTYLGFEKVHNKGVRSYANLRAFDRGIGHSTLSTTIGSSFPLTEKSRVYSERENSTYRGQDGYADIMGYEGTLGDHWDYDAKFERRHLDGEKSAALDNEAAASLVRPNTGNVVSGALGYRAGKKFKARTALEYRRDQDVNKLSQWVTRNHAEYQVTQDLAGLGKLDFGWSRFLDPGGTPAGFMELGTGLAYRPVDFDRFNALARYTYVRDVANDLQFNTNLYRSLATDEVSHVFSIDLAYDLFKHLGIAEKLAYKRGIFGTAVSDPLAVSQFLWGHRFNFHVTRKWDVALGYHVLLQAEAGDNVRHGMLAELDRELYDYVRLGLGYNFTNFDDDLRSTNSYDSHGPYVRLTGKF